METTSESDALGGNILPVGVQPLQPGDPATVGGHRLTGRLSRGETTTVYLARDSRGEPVAVKTTRARDASQVARRLRAQAAAARRIPPYCAATLLADGSDQSPPYLISEYIAGPSLGEFVGEMGPLDPARLTALASALAEALAAIHAVGVIHQDLQPSDILLAADGPRVIGFTVPDALSGSSGTALEVPGQRASGESGADVFAWGRVIGYAATGRNPVAHPAVLDTLAEPVRALVTSALADDPAARPTAQDLLRGLGVTPSDGPAAEDSTEVFARIPAAPEPRSLPEAPRSVWEPTGGPKAVESGSYAASSPQDAPDWARPDEEPGGYAASPQNASDRAEDFGGHAASAPQGAPGRADEFGGYAASASQDAWERAEEPGGHAASPPQGAPGRADEFGGHAASPSQGAPGRANEFGGTPGPAATAPDGSVWDRASAQDASGMSDYLAPGRAEPQPEARERRALPPSPSPVAPDADFATQDLTGWDSGQYTPPPAQDARPPARRPTRPAPRSTPPDPLRASPAGTRRRPRTNSTSARPRLPTGVKGAAVKGAAVRGRAVRGRAWSGRPSPPTAPGSPCGTRRPPVRSPHGTPAATPGRRSALRRRERGSPARCRPWIS